MLKRTAIIAAITVVSGICCSTFSWPPPLWQKNPLSSTALFRYVDIDRVGYIDRTGKVIISPQFDNISWDDSDFSDELLRVELNGRVAYIDATGETRLGVKTERQLASFSEGLVSFYVRETAPDENLANGCCRHLYGYMDRYGTPVIQAQFGDAQPFSEGLAVVREEAPNFRLGRAGYIDVKGKWSIPPQFAFGGSFHEGLAVIVSDGKCNFGSNSPIAAPAVGPRSSCGDNPAVKTRCLYGVIDKSGTFRIRPRYEYIRDFAGGYAAFQDGGKWGFLDTSGQIAISPRFEDAGNFSEGVAAVRQDGLWGYVSRAGMWIIEPKFKAAGPFSEARAAAVSEGLWGFINSSGAFVIPPAFTDASPFAHGLAHVRIRGDKFAWIRPDGAAVMKYVDPRRSR